MIHINIKRYRLNNKIRSSNDIEITDRDVSRDRGYRQAKNGCPRLMDRILTESEIFFSQKFSFRAFIFTLFDQLF